MQARRFVRLTILLTAVAAAGCDDGDPAAVDAGRDSSPPPQPDAAVDTSKLMPDTMPALVPDAEPTVPPDGGPGNDAIPLIDAASEAGAPDAIAAPVPAFVPTVCNFVLPPGFKVRCGHVSVPEDRSLPAPGRQIRLAVAVLASTATPPTKPDPLVFLQGGPGGEAIDLVVNYLEAFAPAFAGTGRELVVFDQRGTGQSSPKLECPEALALAGSPPPDVVRDAYTRCRTRLTENATLERFGTDANAADVEDIRRALGYPAWNLLGVSYGSRLALEVMRAHPQGLRSVIIDGVAPPDINWVTEVSLAFDRSLRATVAACAGDPACKRAYPDLGARITALTEKLQVTPLPTGAGAAPLDGKTLLQMLHLMAYDVLTLSVLPQFIDDLERGETAFAQILMEAMSGSQGVAEGMYHSVVCAEVLPLPTPPATVVATQLLSPLVQATFSSDDNATVCSVWKVARAPEALQKPVVSAIPTLVLSGHFDPITPAAFAEHAAATLSKAAQFVLPDSAHGSFKSDCGGPLVASFLTDPTTKPQSSCAQAQPHIPFMVPPQPRLGTRGALLKMDDALLRAVERLGRWSSVPVPL